MRFSQLINGDSIFIDANIFIYSFGGQSLECKEILLRCAQGDLNGYTSTSILLEILHRLMIAEAIQRGYITDKNPVRKLKENCEIIKKLSTYNYNVHKINHMNIEILDITNSFVTSSTEIRESEGLLTNDSLIAASMKEFKLSKLAQMIMTLTTYTGLMFINLLICRFI